jgi:glycosyltransferase involved in cell wall biosynthesis
MMRRILMLSPWERLWSMGSGGASGEAFLIDSLLESGHSVDLVVPPADVDDFPQHERLRVHRTGPPRAARRLSRVRSWIDLQRRLIVTGRAAGGRPDLVYGLSALATPTAGLLGRAWRVPSIGKLYGTFLLPTVGSPVNMALQFEETLAFLSPVTRLVVHDDGTGGDTVARALRIPDKRVCFWRNGVDHMACARAMREADPAQERQALGLRDSSPLIYTASRLVGWKRVDRILTAMPAVLDRHPNARLVVAGDGSERESLERQAGPLGPAVRFTGAVPRDQNLRFMAVADAFCATYDYSNVGNALLEAMSCGAAVVVTDTGRTRRLVRAGENGLVVPPDKPHALADALCALLDDSHLRSRLGSAARATATAELPTTKERAAREVALAERLIDVATDA